MSAYWFDATIDGWPVTMAALTGFTCGLIGSVFLVRRTALLGDAVSHSVLPGVAIGLFVASTIVGHSEEPIFGASTTMLFILGGALIAGLLATSLIQAFFRYSRIKPDTALGAVFPAFFAVGVMLIRWKARDAHFDIDCIFYGKLEVIYGFGRVLPTAICAVIVVLFFAFGYKEILVTSFDRSLAKSLGMRVRFIDRVLIGLLAMTVVTAFEAVGAILVIALLIVPAATASLLTDRFHRVMILSALFGLSAAIGGCWLTIALENFDFQTSRAPSVAVFAGIQFAVAFIVSPSQGLVAQWYRARALRQRILAENLLGAIYRIEQRETREAIGLEEAAAALDLPTAGLRTAARRSITRGELATSDHDDGRVHLTDDGRRHIEQIIRAHRLWESYMITEMGTASDHVHDAADLVEHHLQPALVRDLEELLGYPTEDPHGREIPGS